MFDSPAGPIGIELTDLQPNGDVRTRARESERVDLLECAKQLYEEGGYPPANVYITWSVDPPIFKQNRALQASTLCELVALHPSVDIFGTEVGDRVNRIREDLPVVYLHVSTARSYDQSDWRDSEFYEVGPIIATALQDRIRGEEPKLPRYLESYAGVWLVLVLDTGGPSTWGFVGDGLWQATLDSDYDRVFLLYYGRERCGELRFRARGEIESIRSAS